STRTKAAHAQRAMTLGPGKDGMSWLTLHLPSVAAEGIWVKCTRTARAIKNQPRNGNRNEGHSRQDRQDGQSKQGGQGGSGENRTLTQLRVDVAASLLLGQQPLPGFSTDSPSPNLPASSTPAPSPSSGAGSGDN